MDDPFDQLYGPKHRDGVTEIPGVSTLDPGTDDRTGIDNRGGSGGLTGTAVTGSDGKARKTFITSRQPGDNYRAAATCLFKVLTDPGNGGPLQVDQGDADDLSVKTDENGKYVPNGEDSGYKLPVVWSKMLTVWRKLHVETDSMARPTFAENTINTQWNQPRFPTGTLTLDIIDQNDSDSFENGFIRIKSNGFPDLIALIINFRHSAFDDEIDTSITIEQWGDRPISGDCTISDDDLANEARFTAGVVGSDIGVGNPPDGFLPLPDTSGLIEHYKPACILPVVENEHDSEGAYPFNKNMIPETKTNWDPGRLILRGLPVSTKEFWTVYVFIAFQPKASADADSEVTNTKGVSTHPEGSTKAHFTWGNLYTGMVAVFAEVLRDAYLAIQKERTVAHEIAHTLGAPHLGDPNIAGDGGLMDKTDQGPAFLAETLKTLRDYVEP